MGLVKLLCRLGKINLIFYRVIQCPSVQSCSVSDTKPVGIKDSGVILASSFIAERSGDKKLEFMCDS